MNDNYCFNLKLEEYAQLSNRSLSAFKRDFQKHFDTTPGKWLLEKRLNHAMNLLSNSNKTVSEAAFESGFENPSHFSRAFPPAFRNGSHCCKTTGFCLNVLQHNQQLNFPFLQLMMLVTESTVSGIIA